MPQSDDPPTPSFLLRAARYGGQDGVSGALFEYAVVHIRLRRRRQVARRSVATAPHSVAPTQQVPRGHVRAT